MAPGSEEERNAILQEVEEALERTTIDKDNLKVYMKISMKGKEVAWMPIMCKRCGRPLYVHAEECAARVRMAKQKATLYITTMTSNETIKQETDWAIIEAGITATTGKLEKEIDFPKWQEGWSWEQYKREIAYYKEATTRKPINQIMDMTRALKESNKADIANRLITKMEEFKNDEDIIDKCVNWITATYGMTKYEEQCAVGEKFLNLHRDPAKDVQEFIAEYDAIMKESED